MFQEMLLPRVLQDVPFRLTQAGLQHPAQPHAGLSTGGDQLSGGVAITLNLEGL